VTQNILYKTTSAAKNCLATIAHDTVSFAGSGLYQSDYIAIASVDKPMIALYQRGKASSLYQCPMQEIVTSLTSDVCGLYLFSGTKKGFIYIHDIRSGELIVSWQAHFKAVTKLYVTADSQYLISAGEDGLCRVWNTCQILDPSLTASNKFFQSAIRNTSNKGPNHNQAFR
jgi:WD40 repeat protein